MNAQRLAALRWAGAATAAVAAASLLLGGVVVWAVDEEAAAPTTTTTPPSTRGTVAPPREEASLVTPDQQGTLYVWHGEEVTGEELLTLDSDVARDAPLLVDPEFVAAHRAAGVDLDLLLAQRRHLIDRLLPVALQRQDAPPGPDTLEVAVVAPPTRNDGTLDVPVMVFNAAAAPRRIAALDLRILGADGAPATERVRFFEDRDVVVPARSGYFNAVTFVGDQVLRPGAVRRAWSFEASVSWMAAPEDAGA
ncbi:MAG TPA: hypothetical protein VM618_07955 [Acidimicrobiia bacterium]|nr:hypothetical protein [Acidimicrobiia bacterium]